MRIGVKWSTRSIGWAWRETVSVGGSRSIGSFARANVQGTCNTPAIDCTVGFHEERGALLLSLRLSRESS